MNKRRSNNPKLPRSGGTTVIGRVSRDITGFAPITDSVNAELIASHMSELMLTHSMYDLADAPGFSLPGSDQENGEF